MHMSAGVCDSCVDSAPGHVRPVVKEGCKGCISVPRTGLTFAPENCSTLCNQNDDSGEKIHAVLRNSI